MAVLVGDLGCEQELDAVVRRREQKRCQEPGNVELGVKPVRAHPNEPVALLPIERLERLGIDAQVESERRPLVPFPVLI